MGRSASIIQQIDSIVVDHQVAARAVRTPGRRLLELEHGATLAGPAVLPSRITIDEGVGGHVPGDDRPRADQGVLADHAPAHDCGVRADAGTPLDERGEAVLAAVSRKCAARRADVCEYHRWPAEHIVFERYTFIDGDVVLNLDVITDANARPDDDVLSDAALPTDMDLWQHVAEVPDERPRAYLVAGIDVGGLMNKVVRIGRHAEVFLSPGRNENRLLVHTLGERPTRTLRPTGAVEDAPGEKIATMDARRGPRPPRHFG
jgi:hypothetical protein